MRGILAKRSEAYIRRKKFRNAVRDCNEALAPIYLHNSQGSTTARAITARFHLRRAIGRNRLCRPTKAMEDYESFKKIWLSLGKTISSEDEGELIEIQQGLPLSRAFGLEDSGSEWEQGEDPDSDVENTERQHSTEVSSITQPVVHNFHAYREYLLTIIFLVLGSDSNNSVSRTMKTTKISQLKS